MRCRFLAAALVAVVVVQLCGAGEIETLSVDNVGEDLGVKVKTGGYFSALEVSGSMTIMQAGGFEEEEKEKAELGEAPTKDDIKARTQDEVDTIEREIASLQAKKKRLLLGEASAGYMSKHRTLGENAEDSLTHSDTSKAGFSFLKKFLAKMAPPPPPPPPVKPWPASKFTPYFPFTCKLATNTYKKTQVFKTCMIAMSTATTAVPNEKAVSVVYNFMKNWSRRRMGKIGTADSAWGECDSQCTSCSGAIDGDITLDTTKGWMFGSCKTVHMYFWRSSKQLSIPKSAYNLAKFAKFHTDFKYSRGIKYMRLVLKKQQVCFPGKNGVGNDCRVKKTCSCAYSLNDKYTSRSVWRSGSQDAQSCKYAYKATDGSGKAFLAATNRECGIL